MGVCVCVYFSLLIFSIFIYNLLLLLVLSELGIRRIRQLTLPYLGNPL